MVIAATNYPDRIDPALLRPGRLDTRIAIPMPSAEDLRGIVRFHLRGDLPDADLGGLAVALAGSTGAHVERIVRIARRRARKLGRELLLEDLFAALGEKLADLPREYLERIAIHEAGHAVAAVVLKVSRNVSISLFHLAEGSAATFFDPQIEAVTRKVVERRIAVALAGRAAEQVCWATSRPGPAAPTPPTSPWPTALAFSAVARWGLAHVDELKWLAGGPEQIVVDPSRARRRGLHDAGRGQRARARAHSGGATAEVQARRRRAAEAPRAGARRHPGPAGAAGSPEERQGAPTAAARPAPVSARRRSGRGRAPHLILMPAVAMTLPQRSVSLLT